MKRKPKSNVKPKTRKKASTKERKPNRKIVRRRPAKGTQKTSSKGTKRTELLKKTDSKRSLPVHKQPGKSGKRQPKQAKANARAERIKFGARKRGKQSLELGLNSIRKTDNKIKAISESVNFETKIKEQLKRKQGKPPRGVVVIIRGKKVVKVDGKQKKENAERSFVSKPSFVTKPDTLKQFILKSLKELTNDKRRFDDLSEDDSLGIFLVDSLNEIEIKFFY